MDFLYTIDNNSILIIPNNIKNKILEFIEEKNILKDIKILTFNDLKNGLYYTYTNETIFFIMNKYNVNYSLAKSYIKDTYYIDNQRYENKKLIFLQQIKNELDNNNLLVKDALFNNLLKSKNKMYIYGYSHINKFNNHLLDLARNYIDIEIINKDKNNYKHEVLEFNNLFDEVSYVADEILKLVDKGIDLNKIYITNYSTDYYFTIARIFKALNIPYFIKNETTIYQTAMGSFLLNNLTNDLDLLLYKLRKEFDTDNNEYNLAIYNKITNILNRYYWTDKITNIKNLLTEELKCETVPSIHHDKEVKLTNIKDNIFYDDEYVFLIGFNMQNIPKFKKDEDYLTDDIKTVYQETTEEYNRIQKEIIINDIKNIKNLTLTYSLIGPFASYMPSFLIDNEYLYIKKMNYTPSLYSDNLNKLNYANYLDRLIKFNENNSVLELLNNSYDIEYKKYNNIFTGIDKQELLGYIDNNLTLSYSNIKTYYQCPFKFYLDSILKLKNYEQNFGAIIGSLFHEVLNVCLTTDKNIDEVYYNFIKENYKLNNKENFYVNLLNKEMHFIIDTIKEQYEKSSHNVEWHEKEILFEIKKNVTFKIKGFVDKILIMDNKAIVIDYKTNDETIDLSLLEYGQSLQLPIYLYLLEILDKNIEVIGLYIQHILDKYNKYDPKKDLVEERKKTLKLDGITFSNEISIFDNDFENSYIKGLKIKDGALESKYLLDINTREKIKNDMKLLIDKTIDNIENADFKIYPIKINDNKKIDGCAYCEYKDICYRKYKDFNILKKEEAEND